MFKSILVPLDGSELAEGSLPHARTMAAAFGACVTLLHVSEAPPETSINVFDWSLRKAEAEAYLLKQAAELQRAGLSVECRLLEGPAAQRIVEYAEQQQMSLIVMSSHGRGGLSRWNLSHIAQKVLQQTSSSILLVQAEHAGREAAAARYSRILAPLDGSRRAECVLPVATRLIAHDQAELILAHVTSQPFIFNRLMPTGEERAMAAQLARLNRARAEAYFEDLATRLVRESFASDFGSGNGAVVETALPVSDNVVLTLQNMVADRAVDLVLLSAHGHSAQSQWSFGSVVTNFVFYGSVPLLVVQDLPQLLNQQPLEEFARRQALQGVQN